MEFSHTRNEKGLSAITIPSNNGRFIGRLSYTQEGDGFRIGQVSVGEDFWGRGFGTRLVREFVITVGLGKRVTARITNHETLRMLYEFGVLEQAKLQTDLTLIGPINLFAHSPILKTFNRGGIRTDSLTVTNIGMIARDHKEAQIMIDQTKKNAGYFSGTFCLEFKGSTIGEDIYSLALAQGF